MLCRKGGERKRTGPKYANFGHASPRVMHSQLLSFLQNSCDQGATPMHQNRPRRLEMLRCGSCVAMSIDQFPMVLLLRRGLVSFENQVHFVEIFCDRNTDSDPKRWLTRLERRIEFSIETLETCWWAHRGLARSVSAACFARARLMQKKSFTSQGAVKLFSECNWWHWVSCCPRRHVSLTRVESLEQTKCHRWQKKWAHAACAF